jgi:hypothetical protein
MVVLSALNDSQAQMNQLFMIDAAVPIEAIDGTASWSTNMIHSDWPSYTNRLWASQWFRLFPTNDARNALTWSNRLASLPKTNIYNFYSSGEEVLRMHTGLTPDFTGFVAGQIVNAIWYGTPPSAFVWALQEKEKGRLLIDGVLSSSHGGWRFNASYNTNVFDWGHLSPAQASLLPDSQLQTNAFFDFNSRSGSHPDVNLLGATGSTYAQTSRNRILSDAIPALTLPVGANAVTILDQPGNPHNFDMNSLYKNGWPLTRNSGEGLNWHHSDFRQVAFTFTYPLFDKLISQGNLK